MPRTGISPLTPPPPEPEPLSFVDRIAQVARRVIDRILDAFDLTPADRVYSPLNMLDGTFLKGIGRMSSLQADQIIEKR
jgi:hypothetical protein